MSALKGAPALRARLKALTATKVFTPLGKDWADEAVRIGQQRVGSYNMPYSNGRLRLSIRRKTANQRKAVVTGSYHSYFVDAGVKPHSMQRRSARPRGRGTLASAQRTIFARTARKGHPGYRARPFRAYMAGEALRRKPMSAALIAAWNAAA
jgi:hypothetical protein